MIPVISFILIIIFNLSNFGQTNDIINEKIPFDSHVHLMSPQLISDWKKLGINFSRDDTFYSDIDTILKRNNTKLINLIGMGYVYTNPEYYNGNDGDIKHSAENDYLLETASRFPENIKPFIAINPLKENALEEIKRCLIINNKIGLKFHFGNSQVYLNVPEHFDKVKPIFEFAAQNNINILLHFDNFHRKFGKNDVELLTDSLLINISELNITIAHFGSSGGFNQKTKIVLESFLNYFKKMNSEIKHNIMFDISAVALDKETEGVQPLTEKDFAELKDYIYKIGLERILFGTDYPLYTANEYIEILKNKVGLSNEDIDIILNNK